ncbi:MAG: TolC family protein [Deltaproteobacteria bacterium]
MKKGFVMLFAILSLLAGSISDAQEKKLLSLEEAINTALENNPGITVSNADIEISRALVRNSKAPYYPEIKSRIVVPFIGRESGFFLDQMIWDFGRTSNRVKSSKAQLKSSRYNKETTKDNIILNTITSYYTVLSQKHLKEAYEKKVTEFEKRLDRAEGFLKAGRASQIEVTKAEVSLGNARLELLAAENDLETAKLNLMAAMGIEGDFDFELADSVKYGTEEFNLRDSIDKALESRSELKSLEAREAAMRANLDAAKKEFYPLIFGRTAYRFEGEGAETPGFIAGIGLQFPIFEGFSRFADVQDARANLTRVSAEIEKARTDILSEVKQLHLELNLAEENIEVTERTRNSTQESLMLARERYRLDRASEVELAEAESLYASTNATYMQALYNFNITAARLERAIGDFDEYDK